MKKSSQRNKIIKAAGRLMNRKGYNGTSLQDISEHVGIHKSTLFHYFKKKEDILMAVLETASGFAIEFIENIVQDKKLTPNEKLILIIKGHVVWIIEYIDNVSAYHSEIRYLSLGNRRKYMNLRKKYESHFMEIIDEVKKNNGNNFRGMDSKIAAFGILGMINWVNKWYKKNGQYTPEEIGDILYRMITEQMVV